MTAPAQSLPAGALAPEARTGVPTSAVAGSAMALVIVLWGLGPPMMKLISAPPLVSVSVRFWIAVPLLCAVTYGSGRRITRETLKRTAVAGALFGANLCFVFAAVQHASVAVMSVVQALQPGVVLLVAGPWMGERATKWHVAWTLVGVGGVVVVVLGGSPEVESTALGFVLSVVAMLTFTTYYLINRRARSTTSMDPIEWMAGVTIFAALTVTPIALATTPLEDYGQLGRADLLYLFFVAGLVGVIGHTMMSWAHRFFPASRSSLYLLAMNVVAVAAAWPLHDEPITLVQGLGGVVVLGAVAAVLMRPASVRVADRPSPTAATSR